MKYKVLAEIDLRGLAQESLVNYARTELNMVNAYDVDECNCSLHEYEPEDMVDLLEMEGFIMLDAEHSLRLSMALAEFKAKLEAGDITVEMIEQLNNKV